MVLPKHPDNIEGTQGLRAIGYWRPPSADRQPSDFHRLIEAIQTPRSLGILTWLAGNVRLQSLLSLPDPKDFVDPSWDPAERGMVIAYLRKGRVLERYFGYSTCRFKCGIDDAEMGDADLTDGTFVWPEGFAHYLEKHNVRPGQDFVTHVRRMTGAT